MLHRLTAPQSMELTMFLSSFFYIIKNYKYLPASMPPLLHVGLWFHPVSSLCLCSSLLSGVFLASTSCCGLCKVSPPLTEPVKFCWACPSSHCSLEGLQMQKCGATTGFPSFLSFFLSFLIFVVSQKSLSFVTCKMSWNSSFHIFFSLF